MCETQRLPGKLPTITAIYGPIKLPPLLKIHILRVQKSDVYTFTDISQNNFQKGDLHWERIHWEESFELELPASVISDDSNHRVLFLSR